MTPAPPHHRRGATLHVPAEPAALARVGAWLERIGREGNLPPDVVFALDLFAQEALGNAMIHGGAAEAGARVEVTCEVGDAAARLELVYGGPAFDPLADPLPDLPTALADARSGGWGLRLMRNFRGRCSYRRDGGRNRVTLDCPFEPDR